MHAWPMPDMQKQIDSIRDAFSADIRKPFVLKASFPYGSPQSTSRLSPSRAGNYTHRPSIRGSIDHHHHHQTIDTQSAIQHSQVSYPGQHPITPPISAGPVDMKGDSPAAQSLAMMASATSGAGQTNSTLAPTLQPSIAMSTDGGSGWNPTRIFE